MQSRFAAGGLLALGGLRGARCGGGGSHWRHGRCNSRRLRTKTQFLQGKRIEFAAGVQPVASLELLQRLHGGIVPLPVGCSGERPIFRQSLLNLGDAVGSGSFLSPLPPPGVFARFPCPRSAACGRARRFASSAHRPCRARSCRHPALRRQEQHQSRRDGSSKSHKPRPSISQTR